MKAPDAFAPSGSAPLLSAPLPTHGTYSSTYKLIVNLPRLGQAAQSGRGDVQTRLDRPGRPALVTLR